MKNSKMSKSLCSYKIQYVWIKTETMAFLILIHEMLSKANKTIILHFVVIYYIHGDLNGVL